MPVPFGFSFGDIIGGIEFICSVIQALEESAGSKSKYQGVISALQSSKDVLTQLDQLHLDEHSEAEVLQIVQRYAGTTENFSKKVAKYDRSLGVQATRKGFKTLLRQIQWQRYGEKEVVWFQNQLQQHFCALNMVLLCLRNEEDKKARNELRNGMQGLSDKIEGQTAATLRTIPSFFALLLGLRQLVQAVLLVLLCISGSIKKLQRAALDISRNTITQSVVMFEDAHGKSYRIQTDFITNWRVFKYGLREAFRGRPGWQRVLDGRFRIYDAFNAHDIDMSLPFEVVFRAGRRIAMDILFDWNETSQGDCQRCGSSAMSNEKGGSICSDCGFRCRKLLCGKATLRQATSEYGPASRRRANQPRVASRASRRMVLLPRAVRPGSTNRKAQHALQGLQSKAAAETIDKPSDFARICIGAEPPLTLRTADGGTHEFPWNIAVRLKARLIRAGHNVYTFQGALAHLLRVTNSSPANLVLQGFEYVDQDGSVVMEDNWVDLLRPGLCVTQRSSGPRENKRHKRTIPALPFLTDTKNIESRPAAFSDGHKFEGIADASGRASAAAWDLDSSSLVPGVLAVHEKHLSPTTGTLTAAIRRMEAQGKADMRQRGNRLTVRTTAPIDPLAGQSPLSTPPESPRGGSPQSAWHDSTSRYKASAEIPVPVVNMPTKSEKRVGVNPDGVWDEHGLVVPQSPRSKELHMIQRREPAIECTETGSDSRSLRRPSMTGWWVCCHATCRSTNNPKLAPSRCPICAHYKCWSCCVYPG